MTGSFDSPAEQFLLALLIFALIIFPVVLCVTYIINQARERRREDRLCDLARRERTNQ